MTFESYLIAISIGATAAILFAAAIIAIAIETWNRITR